MNGLNLALWVCRKIPRNLKWRQNLDRTNLNYFCKKDPLLDPLKINQITKNSPS